jgi:hypothetical protein
LIDTLDYWSAKESQKQAEIRASRIHWDERTQALAREFESTKFRGYWYIPCILQALSVNAAGLSSASREYERAVGRTFSACPFGNM